MCKGERPIGAAKGKQPNTEALCQTPPSRNGTRLMVVRRHKLGTQTTPGPPRWPSKNERHRSVQRGWRALGRCRPSPKRCAPELRRGARVPRRCCPGTAAVLPRCTPPHGPWDATGRWWTPCTEACGGRREQAHVSTTKASSVGPEAPFGSKKLDTQKRTMRPCWPLHGEQACARRGCCTPPPLLRCAPSVMCQSQPLNRLHPPTDRFTTACACSPTASNRCCSRS